MIGGGSRSRHELEHLEESRKLKSERKVEDEVAGEAELTWMVEGGVGEEAEEEKETGDAGTAPLRLICIMFLLPASLRMS